MSKLVMVLLALRVDEQWSCFIGQRRLASEAGCTDRTVRAIEAEFEAAGLIRRQKRYVGHRGRTSDRIYIVRRSIESLPVIDADLPECASGRSRGPAEGGSDLQEPHEGSGGTGLPPNYRKGTDDISAAGRAFFNRGRWTTADDGGAPEVFFWAGDDPPGILRQHRHAVPVDDRQPFRCAECGEIFRGLASNPTGQPVGYLDIGWLDPEEEDGSEGCWSAMVVCRHCAPKTDAWTLR
jgi:hypothetical protein